MTKKESTTGNIALVLRWRKEVKLNICNLTKHQISGR